MGISGSHIKKAEKGYYSLSGFHIFFEKLLLSILNFLL